MKRVLQPVLVATVIGYLVWVVTKIMVDPSPHVASVPW